jgi:Holliday junction resolvase-like predicted endonuclease
LENGKLEKSTAVLESLTAKRGVEFERYVYEYLRDTPATSEVFHSCKTSKQNGNEMDVVFRHDGTTYFVEVKFLLPILNMQSKDGIKKVNEKFDRKIFKETNDATGKPFPEKVTSYRSLPRDTEISHQVSTADDDRERVQVPREWIDGQYEMLVVSNFVPAYLEKHGVRFLTDLELFQWLDNDEDVFYDVLQPR